MAARTPQRGYGPPHEQQYICRQGQGWTIRIPTADKRGEYYSRCLDTAYGGRTQSLEAAKQRRDTVFYAMDLHRPRVKKKRDKSYPGAVTGVHHAISYYRHPGIQRRFVATHPTGPQTKSFSYVLQVQRANQRLHDQALALANACRKRWEKEAGLVSL